MPQRLYVLRHFSFKLAKSVSPDYKNIRRGMGDGINKERVVEYGEFVAIQRDIRDMKALLNTMVETMQRLSIIEERQSTLANSTNKLFESVQKVVEQQQRQQITDALNSNMAARLEAVEVAFRELHIENERHKASFATFKWLLNGAWIAGSAVVAAVIWIGTHLPLPAPTPPAPAQAAPVVITQPK